LWFTIAGFASLIFFASYLVHRANK